MENIQIVSLARPYERVGFNAFVQSSEPFENSVLLKDFSAKAHKVLDDTECPNTDSTTLGELAFYRSRLMSSMYYNVAKHQLEERRQYLKNRAEFRALDAINRKEDEEIMKILLANSVVHNSDCSTLKRNHLERLENTLWDRSQSPGCLFMRIEQFNQCQLITGVYRMVYPSSGPNDYHYKGATIFVSQYVPKDHVIMTVSPDCLGIKAPEKEVLNDWQYNAMKMTDNLTASRHLELAGIEGVIAAVMTLKRD